MNQSKPIWQSKTFWYALLPIVAGLGASIFHVSVSADQWQQLVDYGFAAAGVIGGVGAIIGRISATHVIGPKTAAAAPARVEPTFNKEPKA